MARKSEGGKASYRGVIVPMVTPFTADYKLDEPAVRRIIDHMIAGGVDGIFVVGTTGEAASLSRTMRARLVELAVEQVAGRCTLYAGISDNSILGSIEAAEEFHRMGADAVVAHLPSYYSLSEDEQLYYYTFLLERIDTPLVIYNIPSTTHMALPIPVIQKLAENPKVVALKDSTNDLNRMAELMKTFAGKLPVLVGVTALAGKTMKMGAAGFIPSVGNWLPRICTALYAAARSGDWAAVDAAQARQDEACRIYQTGRSIGQSLAALKAAMSVAGLCGPTVLPPLKTLEAGAIADIREKIKQAGLT